MNKSTSKSPARARTWLAAIGVASAMALASVSAAHAGEAEAKALLQGMSDYMAAQKALTFKYDTNLEVVTKEGQKLALASSGAIELSRPDKIRATRAGGFADVELLFDGKTVTLLGKNLNAYAQAESPGTVDQLVETMRDKFHRPLPAADLLSADPYKVLMEGVTDVKDLGSGVIRGQECDHLAFRAEEVDWQIWIAQGKAPYPCRFVVTSKKVDGGPQYTVDVRDWKAGADVEPGDFTFTPPKDAKLVKPEGLKDFDELPSIFTPAK
jgi:hypothetical protein